MIKKLLPLALSCILASCFGPLCPMADPLSNQLVTLQGKLGALKGKLGTLKGKLGELKTELNKPSAAFTEILDDVLNLESLSGISLGLSVKSITKKICSLSKDEQIKLESLLKTDNKLSSILSNHGKDAAPITTIFAAISKPLHESLEEDIESILNIKMKANGFKYTICNDTDPHAEAIGQATKQNNVQARGEAFRAINEILDKFNAQPAQDLLEAFKKVNKEPKKKFKTIIESIKKQIPNPKPIWYQIIINEKIPKDKPIIDPKPIINVTPIITPSKKITDTIQDFNNAKITDADNFKPHAENIFNKILSLNAIYQSFDIIVLELDKADPEIATKTKAYQDGFLRSIKTFLEELERTSRTEATNEVDIPYLNIIKNNKFLVEETDIERLSKILYKNAEIFLKSLSKNEIDNLIQEIMKPNSLLRKSLCYAHALRAALRVSMNPKVKTVEETLHILQNNPQILMDYTKFDQHSQRIFNIILIPEALFCDIDLINFQNEEFLKNFSSEENANKLLESIKTIIKSIEDSYTKTYNTEIPLNSKSDWFSEQKKYLTSIDTPEKALSVIKQLMNNMENRNLWIKLHVARNELRKKTVFYAEKLKDGIDLTIELPPVLDQAHWKLYINTLDINQINILYDNFHEKPLWNRVFKIEKLKIIEALQDCLQAIKGSLGNFNDFNLENDADLKVLRLYPDELKIRLQNLTEGDFARLAAHFFLKENSVIKQEQKSRQAGQSFMAEARKLIRALSFAVKNSSVDTITDLVNQNTELLNDLIKEPTLADEFIAMYDTLSPDEKIKPLPKYYNQLFDDTGKRLPLAKFTLPKTVPVFQGLTPEKAFEEALRNIENAIETGHKLKQKIQQILNSQQKYIKLDPEGKLESILKEGRDSKALQDLKNKIYTAVPQGSVPDYKNLEDALSKSSGAAA